MPFHLIPVVYHILTICQENLLFIKKQLLDSDFKNYRLEGTQFFKCNLQKADFRDAKGYVIDIHNNQMKAARFSFPDVIRLLETLNIKIE